MPHPAATARDYPNRAAYIMGGTGEVVTYKQLNERSNQGAHLFRSLGLCAGDHICMLMENNRHFLEIIWAAQRSGLIFTPISTHASNEEAAYILGNCRARLFIGSIKSAEMAEHILCEPSSVDHTYMVNGNRAGFESWEEACSAQPRTPIEDESNGAPLVYSPGITGMPKGIAVAPVDSDVSTPPMLVPYLASTFEFDANTVYLSPAPLYHPAPLYFVMMALYQGGTSIVMEKFEAERALMMIERYRVTHGLWNPVMFTRMLQLPDGLRLSYDTSTMRVAAHGGAPCTNIVKEKMIDWWGDALLEYYSSSEGVGVTLINAPDWLAHRGSVGRALVGDIHILGPDGEELPPGETGIVYFAGEHIRFRYHGEPGRTSEAIDERGWATAGDLGYLDEEGFLYLTDREGFAFVSGGIRIYPQELENILVNHEKVADAVVFGVPCDTHGKTIKAVIEPTTWSHATEETAEEILSWLRNQVSEFEIPRVVDFHPNLPRLDNGKLLKQQLVEEDRASAS